MTQQAKCKCDECKSGTENHTLTENKLPGCDLDALESRAKSWEVSPMFCQCDDCGGNGTMDRAWGTVESYS